MSKAATTAGLVAFTVVALLLTVVAAVALTKSDDLQKAETTCEDKGAPEIITVGDDGDTLTVAGNSQADLVNTATACVLDSLDAPDSVVAKVLETTALQGRQDGSWDDWNASWVYHPEQGVQLIVERS